MYPLPTEQYNFLSRNINKDISSFFYCENQSIRTEHQLNNNDLIILVNIYTDQIQYYKNESIPSLEKLAELGLIKREQELYSKPYFALKFQSLTTCAINNLFNSCTDSIYDTHNWITSVPKDDPSYIELRKTFESKLRQLEGHTKFLLALIEVEKDNELIREPTATRISLAPNSTFFPIEPQNNGRNPITMNEYSFNY